MPYQSGPSQDLTVYTILEDFGKHGAAWREIAEIRADERSIVEGILRGNHAFCALSPSMPNEGWARDLTRDKDIV